MIELELALQAQSRFLASLGMTMYFARKLIARGWLLWLATRGSELERFFYDRSNARRSE